MISYIEIIVMISWSKPWYHIWFHWCIWYHIAISYTWYPSLRGPWYPWNLPKNHEIIYDII